MWQDSQDPICPDTEELDPNHYWPDLVTKDPEDRNTSLDDDPNLFPLHALIIK